MALLTGSTPPTSAQGSDGDIFLLIDAAGNKFFYVRASGAWSNAVSTQGPSGPALIPGAGAPAASLGAQGQGYVDLTNGTTYLKSSTGWGIVTSQAFIGPPGPAGATNVSLTGSTFTSGPQSGLSTATTTTANTVLPIPGTTVPQVFVPPTGTSFAGFTYLVPSNSGAAVSFNLYDQSAGNVVYQSGSVAAGTINFVDKRTTTIGLTAGNQHVWRVSAGSNVLAQVVPYYILPAYGSVSTSTWPTAALTSDVTFTGTAVVLRAPGASTANGPVQYFQVPKATYMQYATITVTGSAQLNLTLQTGSTVIYSVSAGPGVTTTPLYGPGTIPMASTSNYVWYASGSGTGQVYVNMTYAG